MIKKQIKTIIVKPKGEGRLFSPDFKPMLLNNAPIAMKLANNAIAGLFTVLIQKKPFKKYFILIIIRQGIIYQHQDFVIDRFPCRLWRFVQKQVRNLYLRTLVPF